MKKKKKILKKTNSKESDKAPKSSKVKNPRPKKTPKIVVSSSEPAVIETKPVKPAKPTKPEPAPKLQSDNLSVLETSSTTADLKPTRRKISRKKPGTKSQVYFDAGTHRAIVAYQVEQTNQGKNKIYLEDIYPAFDSLVENLINVYGFQVMYESRDDLKNECLEFLYGALPKFNAEKGSKAFSYFNVVAKHWLTIKSKQNAKKTQTYISIDNKDSISQQDLETIEAYKVAPDGEEIMVGRELKSQISAIIKEIGGKVKTENEQNCVKAIKILIDNLDEVDLLNKRAILLYLREITGLSSKQLSIVLASLKKHYKELKKREEFQY